MSEQSSNINRPILVGRSNENGLVGSIQTYTPTGRREFEYGVGAGNNQDGSRRFTGLEQLDERHLASDLQTYFAEELNPLVKPGAEYILPDEQIRTMRKSLADGRIFEYKHVGYKMNDNGIRRALIEYQDTSGKMQRRKAELSLVNPEYEVMDSVNVIYELAEVAIETAAREGYNVATTAPSNLTEVVAHEPQVSTPEVRIERKADVTSAIEMISSIIGKNNKGGGFLGEALRKLGGDATKIRASLKNASYEMRESVRLILDRRMSDLLAIEGTFGERVQQNSSSNLKVAPLGYGYEKRAYLSSDYVTLLALARLDGSFNVARDFQDERQHRTAAETLIASFAAEQEADVEMIKLSDDNELGAAQKEVEKLKEELIFINVNSARKLEELDNLTNSYNQIEVGQVDQIYQVISTLRSYNLSMQSNIAESMRAVRGLQKADENASTQKADKLSVTLTSINNLSVIIANIEADAIIPFAVALDEYVNGHWGRDDARSRLTKITGQLKQMYDGLRISVNATVADV